MDSSVRPLTRAEALRRGYTDKQLWGPRFQRLFQASICPPEKRSPFLQRARAALMIAPDGSYASHHTAAALWGAVPPETRDTHICVPDPGPTRSIDAGLRAPCRRETPIGSVRHLRWRVIVECDGDQHRLEPQQWSRDLRRREWLERNGWRIIVINSDAYYRPATRDLLRIRQALADRGASDLPTRTPAAWDRQFASRAA